MIEYGEREASPSILYIMGTGHSGSTILQYLLAARIGALGLGEMRQLADNRGWKGDAGPCSCGSEVLDCPVWRGLQPVGAQTRLDWYRWVTSSLIFRFPGTDLWIDSSKTTNGLERWRTLQADGLVKDIYVIYLFRDVRGWALSDRANRQRKNRPDRSMVLTMWDWWRNQRGIVAFLEANAMPYRYLSYEACAFRTVDVVEKVAQFVGLEPDYVDWQTPMTDAKVHDVFGNRLKNNGDRRNRIEYDDAWHLSTSASLLALAFRPVWKLNRKLRNSSVA